MDNHFLLLYYIAGIPKQAAKSFSGVLIGVKSKVSTRYCNTLGLIKAGKLGPICIFLTPKDNKANKSATAFCSYQDKIIESGKPLTSVSNASANAKAILTAE